MPLFRLRVELPDRPGALAHVASVIADSGASVMSIDIHELAGPTAVDEIVIDGPDGWDAASLSAALEADGAAILLSSAPALGSTDPVVEALEWAIAMAAADPDDCGAELGRAVLEVTSAYTAWVSDVRSALEIDAGRLALERGAPVVLQTSTLPEMISARLPDSFWLLAVPDGHLDPQLVAFAARPLALHFSVSEISRVEQLVRLRRQLASAPLRTGV